jgi:glycosyltransferase involved in cell wall biosynthesis
MRVGINTLPFLDNMAGTERYALNIIKQFAKMQSADEFLIFLSKINESYYRVNQARFLNNVYYMNTNNRLFRIIGEQIYIPFVAKKHNLDIFFSPCNISPLSMNVPEVLTLFDLQWLIYPELFSRFQLMYIKKFLPWSAHKAKAIITLSQHSKKDILKILPGVSEDKIKVIAPGITSIFKKIEAPNNVKEVKSKYHIRDKFILTVCQTHKRKNLGRLIEAFYQLKVNKHIPHQLIIAGGKGDAHDELISFINQKNIPDVIITGYISDIEVCLLYNSAEVMVYPSLFEGYGFPVIEAMACGTPVITSNVSSLPEAAGDAAMLINPYQVDEIVQAMDMVINNQELRNQLIQKGFKHAQRFSWENTAQETIKVLEKVYHTTNQVNAYEHSVD